MSLEKNVTNYLRNMSLIMLGIKFSVVTVTDSEKVERKSGKDKFRLK